MARVQLNENLDSQGYTQPPRGGGDGLPVRTVRGTSSGEYPRRCRPPVALIRVLGEELVLSGGGPSEPGIPR